MVEVDTPAVVVDVDRLEHNLARWQAHCDAVGLANRPHVKTHKSVEIARRQVALGARGVTCQKLGEAEVMADAGIDDILIPYNLIGASKLERLSALARRVEVAVSVDDKRLLAGLAGAGKTSREIRVLVECDTGLGRVGVASPEVAAALGGEIERRDSLRFGGFLTYPARPGAVAFLADAERRARAAGLDVETVSAGGTPTMWASGELRPTVTEYRVGTYAFHDRATLAAGAATADEVALTVRATVVSRPSADRAVLDAGSKVLTHDPCSEPGYGTILEAPGSVVEWLSEEHAVVAVAAGDSLELGQQVRIVPNPFAWSSTWPTSSSSTASGSSRRPGPSTHAAVRADGAGGPEGSTTRSRIVRWRSPTSFGSASTALRAGPFTSAVEHTAGAHTALMEGALRGGLRVAAEVRAPPRRPLSLARRP